MQQKNQCFTHTINLVGHKMLKHIFTNLKKNIIIRLQCDIQPKYKPRIRQKEKNI